MRANDFELHLEDKEVLDKLHQELGEKLMKTLGDHDPVNRPSHYTQYNGLEVIDLTEQMNFNRGNAVKYITRAGYKDEDTELEDLEKAKWYIQREIDRVSEDSEEGESPRRDPNTPHSIIQDMEDGLLG